MKRLPLFTMIALLASSCSTASTDAAADKAIQPFVITEVATFDEPWAMTFLPGSNDALITEKGGKLLLWRPGLGSFEVRGVPAVDYGGQGGLGDVIVSPDFAKDRVIYLSWVEKGEKGARGAVVGKASLLDGRDGNPSLGNLSIIWQQNPKVSGRGHFGHRLAVSPDGKYLFISSSERQKFDPAQDLNANLGKVIRLNIDGTTPSDNPFHEASQPVRSQIWSFGHRNPLGIAFDKDGRLWNTEMGPAGGDELNLVKPGANYGWPRVSNGTHYDGRDIPDHKRGDGFEPPKVFWNPSISPGSLMIYSGDLFPKYKGDAFIGALGGQALIRVDLDGETATKAEEWPMESRIRAVDQGPDGAIWLLEDGDKGRLLKLTPK
jgi:glucose/arabinose dehydrogenase